jgi:hypothetical protein
MSASMRRTYRILAYGIEAKTLPIPKHKITSGRYTLEFCLHKEAPRFQLFDGVIVFQRTFESFKERSNYFTNLAHHCDRDELDKRTKEAITLLGQGGMVCILLADPFVDHTERRDYSTTDLSKRLLAPIDRTDFAARTPFVQSKVNELLKFFEIYGAAWTYFRSHQGDPDYKTLAITNNGATVSFALYGNLFAIPTLVPQSTEEAVEEYFTLLTDSVVSIWEHLKEDLPKWAEEYQFRDEAALLTTKRELSSQISQIEMQLKRFERLKRVLVLQSEPLVEAVMEVFDETLPLKTSRKEAFREDLMLLDGAGKTVALVEVKGVTRGVAREHVNQADNHRERNGMPPEFPSLLVINTNMKNSAAVTDKDQPVASEQVQHATRNNVLILRTLDLLNLASLHLNKTLSSEDVIDLLTTSRGWLKVGDTADVLSG